MGEPMPRLVYIARHGETDWNTAMRWQGHTDIPLNDNGRVQARALAGRLRGVTLAGVVTSDLSRAQETGSIVAGELGLAIRYTDAALRERQYGVFEGLTRAECEARYPDAWRAWVASRTVPPGAEGTQPFTERLVAAIARVAVDVTPADTPVLVVTHGGAMRAMIATVGIDVVPPLANGALWVLTWEAGIVAAEPVLAGETRAP
jgi:probable phosphoglycerate mutase